MDNREYRVGRFTLKPFRQLLDAGAPVPIGRKPLQLLSVLAQAEGALVTKDELMAAVWPGVIVEDNAIQVHVAALRKVLGKDPELLSTSHGLGYRLAVNDGARAPEARAADPAAEPGAPAVGRWSIRRWPMGALAADLVVIALAIALAAGGGAWLKEAFGGAGPATPPTIAVLAFQPADGGADARLFADGLAISLADVLSRYDVTVIATSSSLRLTPAQKSQARARLGADYVVDGRVVSDHGKLTVSTQVSDTRKNVLVYSFDVHGDGALSGALADRIATHLALAMDPRKFVHDAARRFTPADYALIARANEAIDTDDMVAAMEPTRELAKRYPDDGELQAGAGVPIIYAAPDLPKSQQSEFLRVARAYIERAAHLAPGSGLVMFATTQLPTGPMGLATAERLLRRSLELSPTFAPTYNALGEDMLAVGRIDEGVAMLQRSIELDPLSELVTGAAGKEFVIVGREEEASRVLERAEAIWPASAWIHYIKFITATEFGTPREMISVGKTYPLLLGHIGVTTADLDLLRRAVASRDKALVRKFIGHCFDTIGRRPAAEWDHACLLTMVRLGALDDAFAFARRAFPDVRRLYPPGDDRWVTAPPAGVETGRLFSPAMAAFRNDPRFWPLALRAGLVDYWRTTDEWPDFCRDRLATCKTRAAEASGQT